ncbi:hypothetical protein [Burkholderia sp. PU8-34]
MSMKCNFHRWRTTKPSTDARYWVGGNRACLMVVHAFPPAINTESKSIIENRECGRLSGIAVPLPLRGQSGSANAGSCKIVFAKTVSVGTAVAQSLVELDRGIDV